MTTTVERAEEVRKTLWAEFNRVSKRKPPLPVVRSEVAEDADGAFIRVYLSRNPTLVQKKRLPKEAEGVRVKYEATARIRLRL